MTTPNKKDLMPSAPYPPMNFRSPLESALSHTPQFSPSVDAMSHHGRYNYTASSDGNTVSLGESQQRGFSAPHQAKLKMLGGTNDMLVSINCASPARPPFNEHQNAEKSPQSSRKGPELVELRTVDFVDQTKDECGIFSTNVIAVSRGNPSLGGSLASTCLDVPAIEDNSRMPRERIVVATGLTTGRLCVHVFEDVGGEYQSTVDHYNTARQPRQSSAVSWKPKSSSHVAIGLLGSGPVQPQQGPGSRRGGGGVRVGSERDFCCFLWDIEQQQTSMKKSMTPAQKLAHNFPVGSLAWLPDSHSLAIGGQNRNIQIHDLRQAGSQVPPISANCHNFGVHGIEVAPNSMYQLSTFSRTAGEPVKLWDIRSMGSALHEIRVPHSVNSTSVVEAIKWSLSEASALSIVTGDAIFDYDTTSRPSLSQVTRCAEGKNFKDIVLYSGKRGKSTASAGQEEIGGLNALRPKRVLAVLSDNRIYDLPKHNFSPLAISRRDGRLVHALGPWVWIGSPVKGVTAIESGGDKAHEDISASMMRRAGCNSVLRYSMDTNSNLNMFLAEISSSTKFSPLNLTLLRLWSWIDRVESLCKLDNEADSVWSAKSLLDAGVGHAIGLQSPEKDETTSSSAMIANKIYDSSGRRAALSSCGWVGKFDLLNVLSECERLGEYERSACLAVWHGDIGAGVEALQRASAAVRQSHSEEGNTEIVTMEQVPLQYAETLDLVSMCIAGFPGVAAPMTAVWKKACSSLLKRGDLALSTKSSQSTRVAYLVALCHFLLGQRDSLDSVLNNKSLSLCDRVGFACLYLDDQALRIYLTQCTDQCQKSGDVEGLVITGLSKEGIGILQAFVDATGDVQTSALIVSRVVLPQDWQSERRVCREWVECYRGILNTWQMWQSRAMFDVDRAEVLRKIKSRSSGPQIHGGAKAMQYSNRRLQGRRQTPRLADPDILAATPAQLTARCNYCSSPLSLNRNEGHSSQWLSKMKNVLPCCPKCRKPLPRCAICLLSLGCLNPFMELAKSGTNSDDLSSLANLPFAEWFTWCMHCKHGGHAHHLAGWFATHDLCPVAGCDCRCQFDGIQKLKRQVLAPSTET